MMAGRSSLLLARSCCFLFLDVERLVTGNGDSTIASISDGENLMSGYLNVT
jgi:hypothetical protein